MKIPVENIEKIDHGAAGKIIRDLREKNNITLRRLAVALKISAPFLSDMELGRRGWSRERFMQAQEKIKEIKA